MLVLRRKPEEQIVIDHGKVKIIVLSIEGNQVTLGFEADESITINRLEVEENKEKINRRKDRK